MDQKWIQILVILMFNQKMTSGTNKEVKEGESIDIECEPLPPTSSMIIWFRALDNFGMEFIASFSASGFAKSKHSNYSEIFSDKSKSKQTLKAFKKSRDSGIYSCATLQGNELKFGKVTRLIGEEIKKDTPEVLPTKPPNNQVATTTACNCNKNKKTGAATPPPLSCSILILAPLAGGCGLLLLLLIITTVYCNRIRTRRCPHHYKRKLRVAPEKQMMNTRHI
ncbi:T-cell surface glycoprotein CD8 alpha chain isoform X2 [Amphiprion ocellaris]|uniref:T-cell surface glycoprotein CD8 alpha chain isoform X2 n=1 Tax=Amphiprion ocellaris TaxID=80972 RepID=UPI000C30CCE9|nr:T-cell surface glycoprotein CD8 alpha chain isoform X2 [Amphiprion ocellaris]